METSTIECTTCAHYYDSALICHSLGAAVPAFCRHPDASCRPIGYVMEDGYPPLCPLAERGDFSGTLGALASKYVDRVKKEDIRFTETKSDTDEPKSTIVVGRDVDIECAFLLDKELLDYLRSNLPEKGYDELLAFTDSLMFGDGFCGWADTSPIFAGMTSSPIVGMKFSGGTTKDTVLYIPRGKDKSWFEPAYNSPHAMIQENMEFFERWVAMPIGFDYARHIVDIHGTAIN